MAILEKKELLTKILDAIVQSNWNVQPLNNINSHPLKVNISMDDEQENLLIYVWNITHGGKTRSEDEFRIQITGVKKLDFIDNFKTLLLGIANIDGTDVFVAFNPFKHSTFGFSPSIQVNKKALTLAIQEGITFQEKSRSPKGGVSEIVIPFSPTYIIEYITKVYPEYHNEATKEIVEPEADLILKNPLSRGFSIEQLKKLPSERQKALVKLIKAIRDRNFQIGVYSLYEGKCCICGIQANLTEAAHIVAVKHKGTDELTNGFLLCKNHHKAYDMGLLAVDEDYSIKVNKKYVSELKRIKLDNKLDEFIQNSRIGEKIFLPNDTNSNPNKDYLRKNIQLKGMQFFL